MSLVGPRPPIPYELEGYQIWHRRRVLESKPGITGLWQVNGRSRLKFDDMVRLDLQYAKRGRFGWISRSYCEPRGLSFSDRRLLKCFGGAIGFSPFTPRVDRQSSF